MTRRDWRQLRLQNEYQSSEQDLAKAVAIGNYVEAALIHAQMAETARCLAKIYEINLRIYHNRCAGQQSRRRWEREFARRAHERTFERALA